MRLRIACAGLVGLLEVVVTIWLKGVMSGSAVSDWMMLELDRSLK